jgi:hypothetical protein
LPREGRGSGTQNGQVIETKGKSSWGIHPRSTEPKAVSGPARKRHIFNYLRFNEIRPAC